MSDVQVIPIKTPKSEATAIEQTRAAAEVAAAIHVARENPRSEGAARTAMLETCGRLAVASRAFYEVPNRGAGPSIHLARELARVWGNIDYGVRELSRDDDAGESEMQVWAWDQQTNARSTRSFIAPHARMVGKGAAKTRERLTDIGDIYLSNQNVGARAVRECIFAVLPGWFVAEAEERCRTTINNGEGRPLAERITEAVAKFNDLGVTVAQLEQKLDAEQQAWQGKHLAHLTRIYASITIDGISPAEFFPEQTVDLSALPQIDPSDPRYVAPPADQ